MTCVKKYDVYSEKYDVTGELRDWFASLDLLFQYKGRVVEISIGKPFPYPDEEGLRRFGCEMIENYIEKLQKDENTERKPMLHNWYVTQEEEQGEKFLIAWGVVTGHPKIMDSTKIHTSLVKTIEVDKEAKEVKIFTRNTVYSCPYEYCRFAKQDAMPDLISEYEEIKKYVGKTNYPSIEPGNVLLVLSNFSEYYFHSLCYIPEGETDPKDYTGRPHIGTFQDSYLINTEDYSIDLRYFPHYQNIEFYIVDTDNKPLYLENIGDVPLYAKTHKGLILLNPGERKLVARENAEKEKPVLPGGDLYPAQLIEE